jgi:hypothetical protein
MCKRGVGEQREGIAGLEWEGFYEAGALLEGVIADGYHFQREREREIGGEEAADRWGRLARERERVRAG